MPTVMEVLNRIATFDVHRIVKTSLGENRELMLDLNRDQMMQGKRSDGSDITPEYTYFTRLRKMEQGANPDVVSLYDTGDFQRDMYLDVGSDTLEIDSIDKKSDDLKAKYGEKIFGLGNNSREQYIEDVFPEFKNKVETALKLEMK